MTTQINNHVIPTINHMSPVGKLYPYLRGYEVKRVKLDEYGYEEAGVNKGNSEALENHLAEIKEGHLLDVSHSEEEVNRKKNKLEEAISEKQHDLLSVSGNIQGIENDLIPENEQEIREIKEEIRKAKTNQVEAKQHPAHDPLLLWVYGVVSAVLGVYLVLFYASAIHAAFFRNLLQELFETGNSGNISEIMNSIFDPNAIFTLTPSMLYIYFGSSLFIGIGLLAHHHMNKPQTTWQHTLLLLLVMTVPLGADYLLAYKIHTTVLEAKKLVGIEDTTPWYSSTTFWLVIVFGYVAYMAWAGIFHLLRKEKNKRNPQFLAAFLIRNLKNDIRTLQKEIRRHRDNLQTFRIRQEQLNHELEVLHNQLERIQQDPNMLQQNLHQFYQGWLRYLNAGNKELLRAECDKVFQQFFVKHFSPIEKSQLTN